MQKIQSVALIGMGALGILYGHTMARKITAVQIENVHLRMG